MLGYRAEPALLTASLVTTLLMMLPDALLALWLKLLTDGVLDGDTTAITVAAVGLAVSTTLTWYISVVNQRLQRRFRDRLAIAMEAHIARLQAAVPTIEHQERPDYLDRLAVLRNQSFALDHLFSSLLSNIGWIFRLVVTGLLLATIHPALVLLLAAGIPAVATSLWRPGVERAVEESVASHDRLARHLFVLGTTPAPAKEVRVTGIGASLRARRIDERERWLAPIARARAVSAFWASLAWALFGFAYAVGIAWVARGLDAGVGDIVLVVVAGQRLSQYIAQTAGELGFLRGVWLDSSLRLTWLEDYAAGLEQQATTQPPDRLVDGVRFEHVSFRYPGSDRLALDDVDVFLPAGAVVAIVGENGAGKTTLVKLLAGMYRPTTAGSPSMASTWRRSRRRRGERGWRGRSRTSSASSCAPATASVSATRRGSTTSRPSPGRSVEPVPRTSSSDSRRVSPRNSARRGTEASRSRSGSGRSWRWRAASCATSRSCSCSTSRRQRSTRKPSTPCSSATPTRHATARATGG